MELIRNKITFVRYGGLSSVPQKGDRHKRPTEIGWADEGRAGYDPAMPTFHTPPVRRGIYAFVWPYIEFFLLGGDFQPYRMEWVRDRAGKVIDEKHPDYDEMARELKYSCYQRGKVMALARHKKPTYFHYDGPIWHHLSVRPNEVITRKGSWVLSDMKTYITALKREVGRMKVSNIPTEWNKDRFIGCPYSFDHMEVFIEKV